MRLIVATVRRSRRRRLARVAEEWFTWLETHTTLAAKLAIPVLVTTAMLGVGMGLMVSHQVESTMQQAYEQQADSTAIGVQAMYLQDPGDMTAIDEYLRSVADSQPQVVSIRLLNIDLGTSIMASSDPAEIGHTGVADRAQQQAVRDGLPLTEFTPGDQFVTIVPLKANDAIFGAVMIVSSQAALVAASHAIAFDIGDAALASILIEGGFVLLALYMAILRRTRRMQRAIEAVAGGDTSLRLSEGLEERGQDQIFNLARSVDHMIARLDERLRGDAVIRRLTQRAIAGTEGPELIAEALSQSRAALRLESCSLVSFGEDGRALSWVDDGNHSHSGTELPVWVSALVRVSVEARRAVVSDRFGQHSRLADEPGEPESVQAAIVPLPRTSNAGQAIVAVAPIGESIPDGGLVVLDAVAATVAETIHLHTADIARAESAVKSKVMSAVSHEMRNPLNSILGFTSLLLGDANTNLTEKQRRHLGFVQASATNMLTLVNNYLDLAKVRAGSLNMHYEQLRLVTLVNEIAGVMQPIAAPKDVTIRTSVDEDAEARVDVTRLRQILTNLVSNAVKFTPPGGKVYLRARVDDGSCRIAVSDTGVGIPTESKSQVFSEFPRIDAGAMAAGQGTGLGLALTKAFVTALGGTIKFYSRRGRGTTFVVVLPRDGSPASGAHAA